MASEARAHSFKIYVADLVESQVAQQERLMIQGRNAPVVVRLKVDRRKNLETEPLHDSTIDDAVVSPLTTPRPIRTTLVAHAQHVSREIMMRAANSCFDLLEGDRGKSGAVRRRLRAPRERLPDSQHRAAGPPEYARPGLAESEHGSTQAATLVQHVDLIPTDRQQDLRSHDANAASPRVDRRRADRSGGHVPSAHPRRHAPRAAPGSPPGMNRVTMQTFSVRGGLIRHVEVVPFVTLPYELGNGGRLGRGDSRVMA